MAYILRRTPLGLAIRMTGENPHAVDAQGLNPIVIRVFAIVVGSALMALGGSFLTTAAFNSFFPEMVQGRGWICIALVIFASWQPGKAFFGLLIFLNTLSKPTRWYRIQNLSVCVSTLLLLDQATIKPKHVNDNG